MLEPSKESAMKHKGWRYKGHKEHEAQAGGVLTAFLLLQVTFTVQHQTIKAPSTVPGQKQAPDLMLLCSWWKQSGKDTQPSHVK